MICLAGMHRNSEMAASRARILDFVSKIRKILLHKDTYIRDTAVE